MFLHQTSVATFRLLCHEVVVGFLHLLTLDAIADLPANESANKELQQKHARNNTSFSKAIPRLADLVQNCHLAPAEACHA